MIDSIFNSLGVVGIWIASAIITKKKQRNYGKLKS